MHSIRQNDLDLVKFFLSNSNSMEVKEFFRHSQDVNGKNAIHHVVNPHESGSFENVQILRAIVEKIGCDINHKDKQGMTP